MSGVALVIFLDNITGYRHDIVVAVVDFRSIPFMFLYFFLMKIFYIFVARSCDRPWICGCRVSVRCMVSWTCLFVLMFC